MASSSTNECGAPTRGLKHFVRFCALDVAFPEEKKQKKEMTETVAGGHPPRSGPAGTLSGPGPAGTRSGPGPAAPVPTAAAASTHLMNEMYTTWGLPWLSQARS
jgi:hypothetical protein